MGNNINQSRLDFSCGAGSASVNVYNGSLLFARPDISMGTNSFSLGVSHVYGGQNHNNPLVGNGWKLNIQQYIVQSGSLYLYTDENGYEHEFEYYAQDSATNASKYFDRTGLGLTLYINGQDRWIQDAQGGKLVFDIAGRLIETVSAINPAIIKKINYNAQGQLAAVYDNRKPNRKITFSYGGNGLLSDMNCISEQGHKLKVFYDYDSKNNLTGVSEYSNGDERSTVLYKYDNSGRLTYAVRNGSGSALKFDYDSNSRISNVRTGVMKVVPVFDGEKQTTFASSSAYTGQEYTGGIIPNFIGFKVSDNDADFNCRAYTAFQYNGNIVTVTNEKGIAIDYFFNQKGFTTGILERRDGSANDLMTLTKDSGVQLIQNGTGTKINNVSAAAITNKQYKIDKSNNATVFAGLSDYISSLVVKVIHEFADKKERNPKDFVVSFWAKLSSAQSTDVMAKITTAHTETKQDFWFLNHGEEYTVAQPSYSRSQFLDATAVNSWQYITVPVTIETYYYDYVEVNSGYKLRKYFDGLTLDFEGLSGNIEITNMRIAPNQSPEMRIGGKPLGSISQFSYQAGGSAIQAPVSSGFFMTESDVTQTYRNMAYKTDSTFDLVINDGTKRIANITLLTADNISIGFSGNMANYSYLVEGYNNKVETTFQYFSNKIWQTTSTYIDGAFNSYEITEVDLKGKITAKTDEYNVKTTYNYDEYGNPTTATVYNQSVAGDTLTYTYAYDAGSNEQQRENVTQTTGNGISSSLLYNAPVPTLKSTNKTGGWTKEYDYDAFNRLTGVQLKNGSALRGKNSIIYGADGRIERASDSDSHSYKFGYNRFGDITDYDTEYTENGNTVSKKMYKKEYMYDDGTDKHVSSVTEKYYSDNNTVDFQIATYLDKYGRVKYLANTTHNVTHTYQDIDESPSVAKVETIADPYEGKTYTYSYDNENRPCKYSTSNLTVQQTGPNSTKYVFDDSNYETEIVYDEKKLINPRITKTKVTFGLENEQKEYAMMYGYDSLSRLKSKTNSCVFESGEDYIMANDTVTSYDYKPGTQLIEKTAYSQINTQNGKVNSQIITGYEYDMRGNIKEIYEDNTWKWYRTNIFEPSDTCTYTQKQEYAYTGGDQVEYEKYIRNSVVDFHRKYEYNNNGQVACIKNAESGATIRVFTPDSFGRLQTAGGITYEYSNYGNITKIGGNALTYTRGSLLNSYNGNTYAYNYQGIRFRKELGGITTTYYLDGSKILGENRSNGKKLRYFYDANGLAGVRYNGTNYNYLKDALGNITGITYQGRIICRYTYTAFGEYTVRDASGKESSSLDEIAYLNPFRWKSFYLDTETGFYSIPLRGGTRYYDPEIGQFLSPDYSCLNPLRIGGLNPYSLESAFGVSNPLQVPPNCANIYTSLPLVADPTSEGYSGSGGWWSNLHWGWKLAIGVGVIVGLAALTVVTGGLAGVAAGGTFWASGGAALAAGFTGATVAGSGALAATATIAGAAFGGAVIAAGTGALFGGLGGGWQGAVDGFALGAVTGAISGGLGEYWSNVGHLSKYGKFIAQGFINSGISVGVKVGESILTGSQINGWTLLATAGFGFLGGAVGAGSWGEGWRNIIVGFGLGGSEDALGWIFGW